MVLQLPKLYGLHVGGGGQNRSELCLRTLWTTPPLKKQKNWVVGAYVTNIIAEWLGQFIRKGKDDLGI